MTRNEFVSLLGIAWGLMFGGLLIVQWRRVARTASDWQPPRPRWIPRWMHLQTRRDLLAAYVGTAGTGILMVFLSVWSALTVDS